MEAILSHFERWGVPAASVLRELVSDRVHIDVQIAKPQPKRDFFTLFTTGMSALPMTVPEEADLPRYAELMLCLPPSWPVGSEDEEHYWPLRLLKSLARLPHQYETFLSAGHTIPNGDPAEPYCSGTDLCCALIARPLSLPEEAETIATASGSRINLYSVVPLHRAELDLKLKRGSNALFDGFNRHGVTELLDPRRKSTARSKFLGLF